MALSIKILRMTTAWHIIWPYQIQHVLQGSLIASSPLSTGVRGRTTSPQNQMGHMQINTTTNASGYGTSGNAKGTIPLDPYTNCPTLNSAPGFHMCQSFMAHLRSRTHHPPPVEIISYVNSITASEGESEDDDDGNTTQLGNHQNSEGSSKIQTYELSIVPPDQHQEEQHLPLQPPALPSHVPNIDDDAAIAVQDPQATLLRWHYCLNHTPFSKLIAMSRQGILPANLARAHPPTCAS